MNDVFCICWECPLNDVSHDEFCVCQLLGDSCDECDCLVDIASSSSGQDASLCS